VKLVVAWKELLWLLALAGWTCFFYFMDVNVTDGCVGVGYGSLLAVWCCASSCNLGNQFWYLILELDCVVLVLATLETNSGT
jgi:hypothetical protein